MRLIDADAFVKEINDRIEAAIKWGTNAIADRNEEMRTRAEQAVATFCEASLTAKNMPTIDAVPVVRCKDCKHYNAGFECLREGYGIEYPQDWYCADGERKDDEHTD